MFYGGPLSLILSDPQLHRLLSGWYIIDDSLLTHVASEDEDEDKQRGKNAAVI